MNSLDTTLSPRGTRMAGKVCIVTGTGSSKGIGWATVVKFAHEGASHIYAIDIATDTLPELTASLQARYLDMKVTVVKADVTDEDAIKSVCERAVQECGRLDVFFANAGGTKSSFSTFVRDMSVDAYMGTMKLNALSCFLAAKYATEAMTKANSECGKPVSGGSIVFTASIAALRGTIGCVDYNSSKAAVISIAQSAAQENLLISNGVRVNAVCPGAVRTELTSHMFEALRESPSLTPRSVRIAAPEEIANVVLFLASDEARYVTGQHLIVDGGLTGSVPMERLQGE